MSNPVTFFSINEKTVFMPLRYLYPECEKLIEHHPKMYPLKCLQDNNCPANMGCMDVLVRRVNYIFTHVAPKAQLVIAYYKYRDKPNTIRAGIFHRDLSEPYLMVLNPFGFRKFQKRGLAFTWMPTREYLMLGAERGIIPVENIIK